MVAQIYTYTIIRTPPDGFHGAPYCVAVVETDGARETARITGFEDGREIHIGDVVTKLDEPDEFGAVFRFTN